MTAVEISTRAELAGLMDAAHARLDAKGVMVSMASYDGDTLRFKGLTPDGEIWNVLYRVNIAPDVMPMLDELAVSP